MQFHPCLTLEMLAEEFSINGTGNVSNVSIIFMDENYSVYDNLRLLFSGLSMMELKPWNNYSHVSIHCEGDLTITYSAVRIITIESVQFYDCGKFEPVITFQRTNINFEVVALMNTSFLRSMFGFVRILGEVVKLKVTNCLFSENMNSFGVYIKSLSSGFFRDLTFVNNAKGSVSFVDITSMSTSNFSHCSFINNTSEGEQFGSSINIHNSWLAISIVNCTFKNSSGHAVFTRIIKDYLKPSLTGYLEIINSSFAENSEDYGAALVIDGKYNASVKMSNFTANAGIANGGAIVFIKGPSLHIKACNFVNNFADEGGALSIEETKDVSIIDSNFQYNTANSNGGALIITFVDAVSIQKCSFFSNSGRTGGALSISEVHYFNTTSCNFNHNTAHVHAGAVYVERSGNNFITLCTFTANQAERNGGSLALFSTASNLTNSTFINNAANGSGGALILHLSNLVAYDCMFSENQARLDGGAIIANRTGTQKVVIVNSTLFNNSAFRGGALAATYTANGLHLNSLIFDENQAEQGGAVYIGLRNDYHPMLFVHNCNFSNNHVNSDHGMGGAIAIESLSELHLNFSNFTHNTAQYGGALSMYRVHQLNMTLCSLKHNNARGDGGAVSIRYFAKNVVSFCTFIDNTAEGDAGALVLYSAIYDSAFFNISNCIFINNKAKHSGGALRISSSTLADNDSIINNGTKMLGGEIDGNYKNSSYIPMNIVIVSSTLVNNSAFRGGALAVTYVENGLYLNSSNFMENQADHGGGAIYVSILDNNNSAVILYNCSFFNNQVTDDSGVGGAMAVETLYELHLNSSIFVHNIGRRGGALFLYNLDAFIAYCVFIENEAFNGGFIFSNMSVISSLDLNILNNTARFNGGGMFLYHSQLRISGMSRFEDNKVASESGKGVGIFVMDRKDDCNVDSCSISWTNQDKLVFVSKLSNDKASLIFGGMIDRCNGPPLMSSLSDTVISNGKKYEYKSGAITSESVQFCLCENSSMICEKRELYKTLAPGQTMTIEVACVDQLYQPKPCHVKSEFMSTDFELGQGQRFKYITNCEKLNFNAYTKIQNFSTLRITGSIFCNQSRWDALNIHISIGLCPLGFQKMDDRCKCDNRLNNTFVHTQCNIDTNLITIKEGGWFSYDGGYLRIHQWVGLIC